MLDLLSDLNEPQRRAVTHVEGPLLVLAGAGSGKTRVITRRVAHLIDQGVAPWHVLAITFTNKAAGEMRERIEALGRPRGAMICTFHALCARLLREFAVEANVSGNYSIYDRADQLRLIKAATEKAGLDPSSLAPARVHATISNAKNELKTANVYAAQAGDYYTTRVAEIYTQYERLLASNNALDFDDLLLRVAVLIRNRPDIRDQLGRRYQYVLSDEYQDTNHAQYLLAHAIALDHGNICVTGDPDESIYAWRGADIGNILEFENDYPNATVVRLEENYRSTQAILTAASNLISHNRMRKDKALWTQREGGCDVRVLLCDNEHAEAQEVARRIVEFRRQGRDYGDVAILYRLNSLSRVMETALRDAGVPYAIARGVEFFNRKEIKDVLAYLRVMVNPADDVSCMRIINTPARGIGATTVRRLEQLAASAGISMLQACRRGAEGGLSAAAAKKTAAFAELIDSLAACIDDQPVREVVEEVVRRSGIEQALKDGSEEGRQAAANVAEFVTAAAEFDEAYEGDGLAVFLHQVSLVSDADLIEGAGGAVTLMTLHAAKGLEFPVIIILGCEQGLLPFDRSSGTNNTTWSAGSANELEEERRLAFVGMTRAKDELVLSSARRRMIRGKTESQTASKFLDEIGLDGVQHEDLTSSLPPKRPAGWGRTSARGGFYEDMDQRAIIEAMEDAAPLPPEYEHLKAGCRVHHPMFGWGKVTKLSNHPWPDTRADIFFDGVGPKRIVLSKVSLELQDE